MATKQLVFELIGRDRSASSTVAGVGNKMADTAGKFVLGGALIAGALATAAVVSWAKDSIDALSNWQKIQAQSNAVVASTGGVANVTAQHVHELAQSVEAATAQQAESIQTGANMLLTFKNIRNEVGDGNDIFDQAVKAMTDMSVAMGGDAEAGAVRLGKALNDPIAGVTALSKVGVQFTEDQKEQIKALVEAGDVMSAQKIILGELQSQFGGSGAAYADTFAGKMYLVSDALGDIGEDLFSSVLPGLQDLADQLLPMLEDLQNSEAFADLKQQLEDIDWAKIGTEIGGTADNIIRVLDAAARLANSKDANEFWANLGAGSGNAEGGPLSPAAWENGLKQVQSFFGDQKPRGFDVPILTGKDLGGDLDNGLKQIQEFFGSEDPEGVVGSFQHGWEQIAEAFGNGGDQIGQSIEDWGSKFDNGRDQINTFVYDTGDNIGSFFSSLGENFDNGGDQIGQSIEDWGSKFDNGRDQINSFVFDVGANIGSFFNDTGAKFANGGRQMGDFAGSIGAGFGSVGESFANGGRQITSFFADTGAKFANGWNQIAGFFGGLPGMVQGALSGAGSWLVSAGQNIMRGLVQGILNGIDWVVSAAQSAAAEAVAAAKRALGIASPSRVFRDEVGAQISAGMAQGIVDNLGLVGDALDQTPGLSDALMTSGASSAASGSGGGDVVVELVNKAGVALGDLIEMYITKAGTRTRVSLENGART